MARYKVFLIFPVMLSVLVAIAHADTYIVKHSHTDEYEIASVEKVIPAKDEFIVTWFTQDELRLDRGADKDFADRSTIVRLDLNKTYLLDHTLMSYSEYSLDIMEGMTEEMSDSSGIDFGQVMESFDIEVRVDDTGEVERIGNWACKIYEVTTVVFGFTSKRRVWATRDIDIDYDLYDKLRIATSPQQQGAMKNIVKEMQQIDGLEVRSTSTTEVMGATVRTREELITIEEREAPDELYDIPPGYVPSDEALW